MEKDRLTGSERDMLVIAGLGNPGRRYAGTRHNTGFAAIDALAENYGIKVKKKNCRALTGRGIIEGEEVILAKPQTYMNLSGESIAQLLRYYKLSPARLIVICDDINLVVGQLRIRAKGSAGGHNGLKNIIAMLETEDFPRIRIGIGEKPDGTDLAGHVLGRFSEEELPDIREGISAAADAAAMIITDGMPAAMNRYNTRKDRKTDTDHGGIFS